MTLYDRYRFFHEHANYITGRAAECALALARAEERAEKEGLRFEMEDDDLPWDGECAAPQYVLWCAVYARGGGRAGEHLASLGGVGVDRLHDPYLRVVAAELYAEALGAIDAERDHEATLAAAELAARATYAGPSC